MTLVAEKTYTPEDLLNDPDLAGCELVDGHLRERPVSKESSRVGARIVARLSLQAEKSGEAVVYANDLGYRCFPDAPGTIRFPDASVVLSTRDREVVGDPGFMPIPADLAVEVLSPNDTIKEIDEKIEDYLKAGFRLIWIVHPYRRQIQIYRSDGSVQFLTDKDEITGETALPSFRCKAAAFFDL